MWRVFEVGRCEELKAGVHGVVLGSAVVCGLYNLGRFAKARERHSIINVAIYLAITVWEIAKTRHHVRNSGRATRA